MQFLDKQTYPTSNGKPLRPLLKVLSTLLLAFGVAACNNQQNQAPTGQQGQGPTGPLKAQPNQQTSGDMRGPGVNHSMANKPPSPAFQALDTNGDGQISVREAKSNPKLAKMFKSLDDGDGQLNKNEFTAFEKRKALATGKSSMSSQSGGAVENANRPKNLSH
ncbi:MAG: EF-hand domain-containing protein [Pseudomonadota bacterium]|nr:EF-hand domain-containing protein [Pseudomonadota bacterium]